MDYACRSALAAYIHGKQNCMCSYVIIHFKKRIIQNNTLLKKWEIIIIHTDLCK